MDGVVGVVVIFPLDCISAITRIPEEMIIAIITSVETVLLIPELYSFMSLSQDSIHNNEILHYVLNSLFKVLYTVRPEL
ncbi:MAG: hypothetical protein BAJATHORv1_30204 [Candidatus Thorarchaeota archaeon]|nr:MAG: hypothetical protein BAJATHORv1_30204 [Candidatus Thorarchaeota archaeon]